MKKMRSVVLFFALVLCLTCASSMDTQAAVKLSKSSLSLLEGQSATLKLTGTKKKVKWKSDDKTVATVTSKGKVTAKAPGNAVISATAGKTTKKCKVTVSVNYANSYEYQVKYGKVTINKLLRISEADLVIPETIEGYPVTDLADGLFKDCDGLVSITLPASITKIGDNTFYGCHMLREVKGGGTITSIGSYAFYECNVLETFPDLSHADSIGDYAFFNCDAIASFSKLPLSLKSLGSYAFSDCDGLLTFYGSDLLTSVGDGAFKGCDKLMSVGGCKNVQTIGSECYKDCKNLSNVSLGNKVTTLGFGCFSGCEKLGFITMPGTITAIPDHCFYNCYALSNVTVPTGVTKIGNMAFFNCIGLRILTFPGTGITSIAADSFAGNVLKNVNIYYFSSTPKKYIDNWVEGLGLDPAQIHTL